MAPTIPVAAAGAAREPANVPLPDGLVEGGGALKHALHTRAWCGSELLHARLRVLHAAHGMNYPRATIY